MSHLVNSYEPTNAIVEHDREADIDTTPHVILIDWIDVIRHLDNTVVPRTKVAGLGCNGGLDGVKGLQENHPLRIF